VDTTISATESEVSSAVFLDASDSFLTVSRLFCAVVRRSLAICCSLSLAARFVSAVVSWVSAVLKEAWAF